jgi:hypothetical protein
MTKTLSAQESIIEQTEMTERDQLLGEYSDLYKEVNGFRPRNIGHWTVTDFQVELELLHDIARDKFAYEAKCQQQAIVDFEKRLEKMISMGAADRATAIRWLACGEEQLCRSSIDRLEYDYNLPYGYLMKMLGRIV